MSSGRVHCDYTSEWKLSRALGIDPWRVVNVLEIEDGHVQSLRVEGDQGALDATWNPFRDWVERNHTDDVALMFDPDGSNPILDDVSIALWERYTDEESLASFVTHAQQSLQAQQSVVESSLATVNAFMAAWVAGDGEAAAGLFNPGGTYGAGVTDPEGFAALHDWYRAVGWEFQNMGCRPDDAATPNGQVVVGCSFTAENDLGRALDWPLVRDGFNLVIDDGRIDLAWEFFGFDAYRDLWFTFKDWVAANHPSDLERMFLHPTQGWPGVRTSTMMPPFEALNAYPLFDESSIALWEQYTDEFVASSEAVARATKELEAARFVAGAVEMCIVANDDFSAEVDGLMHSETEDFQQFFVDFSALQSVADWHEARARHADAVIARLRALPAPGGMAGSLDQLFTLMEEENNLTRQVAAAAIAGDQALVDTLIGQRVDATHRKDMLAFRIGYALYECPIWSGGA
jgi:hypothetical protein